MNDRIFLVILKTGNVLTVRADEFRVGGDVRFLLEGKPRQDVYVDPAELAAIIPDPDATPPPVLESDTKPASESDAPPAPAERKKKAPRKGSSRS